MARCKPGSRHHLRLAAELRKSYGSDLKQVVMSPPVQETTSFALGDKKLSKSGAFMETNGPRPVHPENAQGLIRRFERSIIHIDLCLNGKSLFR